MIVNRVITSREMRTGATHVLPGGPDVDVQRARPKRQLYCYLLLALCFSTGGAVSAPAAAPAEDVGLWPAVVIRHVASTSFYCLKAAPNGTQIAVGESGTIARSSDGKEWVQSASPISRTLTAVVHVEGADWVAVGWDGIVLKSYDDGVTWRVKRAVAENSVGLPVTLLGVYFVDTKNGFAVGTGGTLLATSDAGENWAEQILKNDEDMEVHLYGVTESKGRIIIVGELGSVFVRESTSNAWKLVKFSNEGTLFGVISRGEKVFAYGLMGSAFLSNNGGYDWESIASPRKQSWFAAAFLDDGALVAVGAKGNVGYLVSGSKELRDYTAVTGARIPELNNFMDVLYEGGGRAVIASMRGLISFNVSKVD